MSHHSEVVVVGAGLAGICSCLELLDAGRRVLLVDRDVTENLGGLAKESFGGIFVVGSDEQRRAKLSDSPERALADWHSFAEFADDDVWPRRWAEAYVRRCRDDVYRWLKARGIGFFPVPHWVERGQDRPGNSVPRFHLVWGTGRELTRQLLRRLQNHPQRALLSVECGLRIEGLSRKAGRIDGVRGFREGSGETFEASADCVVIAAGGINGDLKRVARHWHPDWRRPPAGLLNGSHRYADGRMHDAVLAAGGRLTRLDSMWDYAAGVRHWAPAKPAHGLSLVPPRSALWLDSRGERFEPPLVTGFDTRDLVSRVCASEAQYSWLLMNRKIAIKELAVSGAEFNPSVRDKKRIAFLRDLVFGNRWLYRQMTQNCEDFVVAGELTALVAGMNRLAGDASIDAERLAHTLAHYDGEIMRGEPRRDRQLQRIAELRRWRGDRIRTCAFQQILDRDARPLIAVRAQIISRKSLGGIQTDLSGRVLDAGGAPIDGLYAAGEAAGFGGGGMHGLRALEGTFLGGCILGGRIAGRAIAGHGAP